MKIVFLCACFFALATAWPVAQQYAEESLQEDFNDFLKVLPVLDMVSLGMHHLATNKGVQNAVLYFKSEDFTKFILCVEELQEFKKFLAYLDEAGINIYDQLQILHDVLGLPSFVPPSKTYKNKATETVCDLVNEIKGLFNDETINVITKLYTDKKNSKTAFQELIEEMKSQNMKTLVTKISEQPQFKDLLARIKGYDCIDTTKIGNWLHVNFGWGTESTFFYTSYNLKDDLQEFLALLPTKKMLSIGLDYFANDKEVQDAVEFVLSGEFKDFILEVEDIPEYRDFLKYLDNAGLDIYEALNKLHDILDLPNFVPKSSLKRGKGIRGLVDDIEAILPIDEIKNLFNKKLENSPDFKNLVDTMRSDAFKHLVEKVRANPEYTELVKRAKQHGLDIELIAGLVNKIFGWGIEI